MTRAGLTKKRILLGSVAGLATLSLAIFAIVFWSVFNVTGNANRLDDSRSRSTVSAALNGLAEQIAGVARDNAVWDDAAVAAYQGGGRQWFIDNWGLTTKDYPLYNEAVVVNAAGKVIIAYDDGETLAWSPSQFYGPTYDDMLQRARISANLDAETKPETAFVMTPEGLTILAFSTILPSSLQMTIQPEQRQFVLFSRQIDTADITSLGDAYVVPGLTFATTPAAGMRTSEVKDGAGATIGYLSWPSQNPGDASFRAIAPMLGAALALFSLMLAGFVAYSRFLVDDMRRDKQRAEHESTHDPLSGLINRSGLFALLTGLLANRIANVVPTLVYMDLDGFKDVNDSYGHAVGDALIRDVSAKLQDIAHAGALVSRLGGDEFAVVVNEGMDAAKVDDLAEAIHRLFKEPFDIAGRTVVVGASIGIARATDADMNAAELVRQADLAMYRAKDMGRGRTVTYEHAFDEDRAAQNLLECDLRETIAANDLSVAFQPLVDARTSCWHGVEALARWHNKRLGTAIGPDVFIPIAERSGLIELLGLQILRKALIEARKWPQLQVSVNVSPAQFRNPAFPEHVARIVHETGADPARLTLEITEGFFVRNPERAQRIVKALKALGISISLDDFGSGYSSIGYLRQFEFDRLKIDRSFISALDREANAPSVIQATVALANAFNIPVTAEGVEREDQAAVLRLSGCDEFQGYLFGKPMTAYEIDRIVDVREPVAASAA